MNLFAISGLLIGIGGVMEAFLMFIKGKNKLHYLWGIFCISYTIWGFGAYKIATSFNQAEAILWWRIAYIGVIFIPIFLIHFTYEFLSVQKKWHLYLFYTLGIFFEIINFIDGLLIDKVRWTFNQFYYLSPPALLYTPFVIFFFGTVIYSLIKLLRAYLLAKGIKKIQIKYIIIALAIGFSGGSFSFLPVYYLDLYPALNLSVSIGILIVAYAILRYRLMDLRIIARKIFIYLGIAVLTYALFYLVAWTYLKFFGGIFNQASYLTGLIVAPIFVVVFLEAYKFLQNAANKYFFAGLYNYQETINKLADELNYYIDLDKIVDLIVGTIKKTMQLNRAGVLLIKPETSPAQFKIAKVVGFNEQNGISLVQDNFLTRYLQKTQRPLVRDELALIARDGKNQEEKAGFARLQDHMKHIEASLCLPLMSSNKLIGIIVLGAKLSNDAYTKEDLELLNTVSKQAGIALDNARLYQQVQNFNKTLKQKVDEQTKEIKTKNVHLEELLKMKTEFLDIASHQLKTPISIVRGYLSMILDGSIKGAAKVKDGLKKAMSGIERLNQTTKDFLDASDLEGKEIELEIKPTDLSEMVKELFTEKELLAKNKGLQFTFTKPPKPVIAPVDASWLSQAVSNFIDNAIFYTEKGEVAVTLETQGNQAIIKVKDTGIGIAPEDQNKLFTKFTRSKNAILAKPDGSGLGLYIAKKIIDLHQGKIEVQSTLGQGTSFIVSLPL